MVQTDEERKKKARDRAKKYLNSAKGKAKDKARKQTPAYKAKAKAHKQTPAYKAWRKEYDSRLKNKAKAKTRKQTSEYTTRAKNFADQNRLKFYKSILNVIQRVMCLVVDVVENILMWTFYLLIIF